MDLKVEGSSPFMVGRWLECGANNAKVMGSIPVVSIWSKCYEKKILNVVVHLLLLLILFGSCGGAGAGASLGF